MLCIIYLTLPTFYKHLLMLHFLKAFSPNVLTWHIKSFSFKSQGTLLSGGSCPD